jgi:hypothetical protein
MLASKYLLITGGLTMMIAALCILPMICIAKCCTGERWRLREAQPLPRPSRFAGKLRRRLQCWLGAHC